MHATSLSRRGASIPSHDALASKVLRLERSGRVRGPNDYAHDDALRPAHALSPQQRGESIPPYGALASKPPRLERYGYGYGQARGRWPLHAMLADSSGHEAAVAQLAEPTR